MPRFLVPILLLALTSLVGFGLVVLKLNPGQTFSVILFLVTFFFSTASLLSLILFLLQKKFFFRPKTFTAFGPLITDDDLRPLFRTSFRRAVLVSFVVIVLAVLKLFGRLSWQTVSAAAVFTTALEIYLWRKH